jgi:hypothetical protein
MRSVAHRHAEHVKSRSTSGRKGSRDDPDARDRTLTVERP